MNLVIKGQFYKAFIGKNLGHFPIILLLNSIGLGAQWLSGRVLDSRLRGPGLEPHVRHCVVSLILA